MVGRPEPAPANAIALAGQAGNSEVMARLFNGVVSERPTRSIAYSSGRLFLKVRLAFEVLHFAKSNSNWREGRDRCDNDAILYRSDLVSRLAR